MGRRSPTSLITTLPARTRRFRTLGALADEANAEGNISGFVRKPARLDPAHLQRFVNALAKGEIVQPVGVSVGQNVVVTTGPFASFPAVVEALYANDRIKLAVSIFGGPSPVELGIAAMQPV